MNKPIKTLLLLFMIVFMGRTNALADVSINSKTFPDKNFRNWIINNIAGASDKKLTDNEIKKVYKINVNKKSISNLTGIGYFTSLKELHCKNNSLTSLDLSKNTNLKQVNCHDNKLKKLVLGNNKVLEILRYPRNKISSFDYSKYPTLRIIECDGNGITSINVKENSKLQYLACRDNSISSIDLTKNTELLSVSLRGNNISTLDVRKNTKLKNLYCQNNKLTTIDVSNNKELTPLDCSGDKVSELKLTANTKLDTLKCYNCNLSTLDISKNVALQYLYCKNNHITAFDLSNNKKLKIASLSPQSITRKYNAVGNCPCFTVSAGQTGMQVSQTKTDNKSFYYYLTNKGYKSAGATLTVKDDETLSLSSSALTNRMAMFTYSDGVAKSDVAYYVTKAKGANTTITNAKANTFKVNVGFEAYWLPVNSNGYSTLCLPYNAEIPSGVKVYTISGYTADNDNRGGKLTLHQVTGVLPANTPVIVNTAASASAFNYTDKTASSVGTNLLSGTLESKTVTPQSVLVLGPSNETPVTFGFYKYTGNSVPAFFAYLDPASLGLSSLSAKNISIVFEDGEQVTGIDFMNVADKKAGDNWYTIDGVRLDNKPSQSGVYIHNGKKVVVKE